MDNLPSLIMSKSLAGSYGILISTRVHDLSPILRSFLASKDSAKHQNSLDLLWSYSENSATETAEALDVISHQY